MKIMHDLKWWECFVAGAGYGFGVTVFDLIIKNLF